MTPVKITDAQTTMGQLIDEHARRDAIHFAVAPVIAAHMLAPGVHVGLNPDGTASQTAEYCIGIVDPFLRAIVPKGGRFWLILYPNTITGLRHVWEHEAFKGET